TYTARLRVMDSAGQMAETTRSVSIVAVGEVSSQVVVNYSGPGDGLIEIRSTEPGFVPVRCSTSTPAGQPTDTGTCTATVRAGYDITVAAEYDPVRSTFSGWSCRDVVTSTTPSGTRTECRFIANNRDLTFEATFLIAPPLTEILRVELHPFSQGGGEIFDASGRVYCTVQNQRIRTLQDGICSYSFDWGTTIHLYAAAQPFGSRFVGWQGCDSQPSPTECVVSMTRLREVTAHFSGG
ncbi:MAG TPA: hypothetical protein VEW08_05430, partial [Steroidobacteraceae bacterium]|nr:hypothetical protein [Steroidobacteraceae bacterium]